jgi:hypothetical protein
MSSHSQPMPGATPQPRAPHNGRGRVAQRLGFSPAGVADEHGLARVRMLGFWSARTIFLMGILYVAGFIAGFASAISGSSENSRRGSAKGTIASRRSR